MRLIAFVTEPASVKSVLKHLGLPGDLRTIAPARVPLLDDLDQTSAFDLTGPAQGPDEPKVGLVREKQNARVEYEFGHTVSW